ncbi:MAG: recombination protein RecR [Leptospiraceae bacterium]|nr:recombination protein RecR [Leptospiraceae bacterium]MCP5512890.1 recombination protein RecR [Leptospiraceae bacterium]
MTEQILKKLVSSLSSLPGIGRKSALRIGFHMIRMDEDKFHSFIHTLVSIKESIKFCKVCAGLTELEICEICSSPIRNSKLICVVEQPEDILFIENTGEMSGKYHVLNGSISPLDGIGPDKLRIKELLNRLKEEEIEELLLATNPTLEGDATAGYISSSLKDSGIKISRIAHGISVGSTLEFADQYTLGKAIRSRLPF